MCLALPRRVTRVEADEAVIAAGERERRVSAVMVPGLEVGDYVIVAGDVIVDRLEPLEAEKRLALFSELEP